MGCGWIRCRQMDNHENDADRPADDGDPNLAASHQPSNPVRGTQYDFSTILAFLFRRFDFKQARCFIYTRDVISDLCVVAVFSVLPDCSVSLFLSVLFLHISCVNKDQHLIYVCFCHCLWGLAVCAPNCLLWPAAWWNDLSCHRTEAWSPVFCVVLVIAHQLLFLFLTSVTVRDVEFIFFQNRILTAKIWIKFELRLHICGET